MPKKHQKSNLFGEPLHVPLSKHKVSTKEEIVRLFKEYSLAEAEAFANTELKTKAEQDWYITELKKAENNLMKKVKTCANRNVYNEAHRLYINNTDFIEEAKFEEIKKSTKSRIEKYILEYAAKGLMEDAEQLFNANSELFPTGGYYWVKELQQNLNAFDFKKADELFEKQEDWFAKEDYYRLKATFVKAYFESEFRLQLDPEQAMSLSDTSPNILVTARAGSGKTRLLTAKAALLFKKYAIEPNTILLLAFNTDAAKEMKSRLSEMCNGVPFNNIRTFHSLACGILNRPEIEENPDRIIKKAIKELIDKNKDLRKELYEYFRNGSDLTDDEYKSIRNHGVEIINGNRTYISLDGRFVKSKGEKWIADFLFEHTLLCSSNEKEIWNAYEKAHRDDNDIKRIVKPDFTFGLKGESGYLFVLEHWAINKKFPLPRKPIWGAGTMTKRKYSDIRQAKRNRFKGKLLETFPDDMAKGRKHFEDRLQEIFRSKGIDCCRKEQGDLLNEAYNIAKNRPTNLFTQFIRRCQQKNWSPVEAEKQVESYKQQISIENEKVFLRSALEIYRKYQDQFIKSNGDIERYDFSMLLPAAAERVNDKSELSLKYYDNEIRPKNQNIAIADIRYVLIDEYQDFSRLFSDLTKAIQKASNAMLFCVGDDWQAINSFAGSDLEYFHNFDDHYSPATKHKVKTNYRSGTKIVTAGNKLMEQFGDMARSYEGKSNYDIEIIDINNGDYYVNYEENANNDEDQVYVCRYSDSGVIDTNGSMLLKAVYKILSEQENFDILKNEDVDKIKCLILSRIGSLYSFGEPNDENDAFIEKLIDCFGKSADRKNLRKKIARKTVHKAKGEEAEIVIVLNCYQRSFPMLHPDSKLFGLFGVTEKEILEEERRLFYVAITRAKQKLYLFTENGKESEYLKIEGIATKEDLSPL